MTAANTPVPLIGTAASGDRTAGKAPSAQDDAGSGCRRDTEKDDPGNEPSGCPAAGMRGLQFLPLRSQEGTGRIDRAYFRRSGLFRLPCGKQRVTAVDLGNDRSSHAPDPLAIGGAADHGDADKQQEHQKEHRDSALFSSAELQHNVPSFPADYNRFILAYFPVLYSLISAPGNQT